MMMTRSLRRSLLFLCLSLPLATAAAPLRVVIVGDSTVCNYPVQDRHRGWGQFVEGYFRPGAVEVHNLAKSGASTKSFLKEGLWQRGLDVKPDIVLIQFGHNDSHDPSRAEATDAATDYRDYLRRFIDEARGIGATPILVTPMCRRVFDPAGKIADQLGPYADAMKAVGAEKSVPVIDLNAASKKLCESLGAAGCRALAFSPTDVTHFNEKGARAMAELVMKELPQREPRLRACLSATESR